MRELERIQQALAAAFARGEGAMLVTVLGVKGSVYRGAGARMVVTSGGEAIGGVSGGCLEADIAARAPDVLPAGRAELARYDTRATVDDVPGLGLGCKGSYRPVPRAARWPSVRRVGDDRRSSSAQ